MLHIYNLAPNGDDCIRVGRGRGGDAVLLPPGLQGGPGESDAGQVIGPES